MKIVRLVNPFAFALVAVALTGCFGVNGKLGPISGKIVNYSGLPTEQFSISYAVGCNQPTIRPSSCGVKSDVVHPDANGNYTIPALDARSVTLTPPSNTQFPNEAQGKIWSASDGQIENLVKELRTITVFAFDPQDVQYDLASGLSSESWATGEGRDATVSYDLDFSLGKDNTLARDYNVSFVTDGLVTDDQLEKLKPHLLFIPGSYAANAPVELTASVADGELSNSNLATIHEQIAFSSVLPESVRSFSIDDRNYAKEIRQLDGQWTVMLSFNSSSEIDLFNGTLNVLCSNGVVSGELALTSAPASAVQLNGSVSVTGTCSSDTGELRFSMQSVSQRPASEVVIQYQRLGGAPAGLLQKGSDINNPDAAYTGSLLITDADGTVLGTAMIDKK
jgi:hypothetical protein